MKQLVTSLITAMQRSRSDIAEVGERVETQAQGTPMTELTVLELRAVAGGGGDGTDGPHGSWGANPIQQ
jgi:hypothetical protein